MSSADNYRPKMSSAQHKTVPQCDQRHGRIKPVEEYETKNAKNGIGLLALYAILDRTGCPGFCSGGFLYLLASFVRKYTDICSSYNFSFIGYAWSFSVLVKSIEMWQRLYHFALNAEMKHF